MLLARPEAGAVVKGAGGLRKVRFAPPSWNTGKSGATPVCYVHFTRADAVYFLAIYAKSEQGGLTPAHRAGFKKLIEAIDEELPNAADTDK